MKKWVFLLILVFALPLHAAEQSSLRRSGKLYKQKKYGQALAGYNQILAQNPQNTEAALGAGSSAYYLKDYASAQQFFTQASQIDGKRQQDALFNLGNASYRGGEKDKAIAAYRKAILKNPNDKEAIHNLQLLLQENNKSDQNKQNNSSQNDKNNKNNSKKDSPNNNGHEQEQQQKQNNSPATQEKESADRVMQMSREKEYKRPAGPSQPQESTVEKDW